MKKTLAIFLTFAMIMLLGACSSETENAIYTDSEETTNDNKTNLSETDIENLSSYLVVNYGDEITITGVILKSQNKESYAPYYIKLNNDISITLIDGDLTEEFTCDILYFYADSEINGNYNFDKILAKECSVTASLENYRGGGELFLLNPTIMTNGTEAETLFSDGFEYGLYSTAPILAEDWHIIPHSYNVYGRVSLDETAYRGYEGNTLTPKDPYRLSLTIEATENNLYFIQRIYMDTLIFDEFGEMIKDYHTEYVWHEMTENLNKIETLGFDNSIPPKREGYQITENWSDFPKNAHSAAILLSFDVFVIAEYGICTPDYNLSVPPYEIRYVVPQAFDAFLDIMDGKVFEHR